ncbi:hypothetical protein [Streptomyces yunnanensis]|uniref:Uncharacterized protein n=1 Tax=Streptomyces yunnanensis TaxID=156453 RepID=A0A9X8N7X4_9ACTN|nr:hypothetical protein [Streptomyces yunnanensis]SHN24418.1 hypothetical protein SAMN05216268_12699 [Streptomyces yunnanensis]
MSEYTEGDRVYLRNMAGGVMFNEKGHPIDFRVVKVIEWENGGHNFVLHTHDRNAQRMYGGSIGFPGRTLKRVEQG